MFQRATRATDPTMVIQPDSPKWLLQLPETHSGPQAVKLPEVSQVTKVTKVTKICRFWQKQHELW